MVRRLLLVGALLFASCAGSDGDPTVDATAIPNEALAQSHSASTDAEPAAQLNPDQLTYTLVDQYPHDREAFTQGFAFAGTKLYEGTGLEGASSLRRVRLSDGEVLKKRNLPSDVFGEGITILDGRIYQITWQEGIAYVYNRKSFKLVDQFSYKGEGWGLTDHAGKLIMSNGSDVIRFRNPKNFKGLRKIEVTDDGQPVDRLNELEWIDGAIWANVWQTNHIARIDPDNGRVTGWLDLTQLAEKEQAEGDPDVLNGIAYMSKGDRMFVTGKWWRHVYEIRVVEP